MTLKLPKRERSAGISVFFTQVPLAKPKKSSPAAMLRSMPLASKPKLPSIGLAAAGAASAGAVAPTAGSAGRSQAARDRLATMASARVGRRSLDMDFSCSGKPQV